MARLTEATNAVWMSERESSKRRMEPPAMVSRAGAMSFLSETWSIRSSIQARRASSGGNSADGGSEHLDATAGAAHGEPSPEKLSRV